MLKASEAKAMTQEVFREDLTQELDAIEKKIIETASSKENRGRVYHVTISKPSEEAERTLRGNGYRVFPAKSEGYIIVSWK